MGDHHFLKKMTKADEPKPYIYHVFSAAFSDALDALDMTDRDFGKKVRRHENMVYKWRHGKAIPKLPDIFVLANALQVPPGRLLGLDTDRIAWTNGMRAAVDSMDATLDELNARIGDRPIVVRVGEKEMPPIHPHWEPETRRDHEAAD